MTKFVLIDNEHQLHKCEGDWEHELGPEGPAQVVLHPGVRMTGFVNDCGFSLPDRYPRNLVGALMVINLGAVFRPLAGPLVITGWNTAGCGSEIRDLSGDDIETLAELHHDLTAVLDGTFKGTFSGATWWRDLVLRKAAELRAASTPSLVVRDL
ncbi:hypothetical protein [Actinomadura litoris]|uniref:hypothetical protein n=1 Tax=Actinomadura litoris TaxID=2678616 RepID=UPI001FA6D10A|nr:hypothetical protein [Actinomadura litoris]